MQIHHMTCTAFYKDPIHKTYRLCIALTEINKYAP